MLCVFFFLSSRRRHTRWPRDWSSVVCSSDLEQLAHLYTHINNIEEDFIVNLGRATITLNDYEKLEAGDVIPLNYVTDGVECTVGNKKKFEAKIGGKDNRYAVKIMKAMKWRDGKEERESKVAKLKEHIKHFKKR